MNLRDKKIIVGVSGGIAAYKSAELVRLLKKCGAEVIVVMTQGAEQFISRLTLQALSARPVRAALFDLEAENAMGHIELARWADLLLIAPASAHVIAKLACGLADDLLTTLVLASTSPLVIAPAMNQQMWRNSATQQNIIQLKSRGCFVWGPASGEQACGDVGLGRLLEPETIVANVDNFFAAKRLQGKKVVITAGPTRELVDPVRYFTNFSSGKMGYALAEKAAAEGAEVVLISGPSALPVPAAVHCIPVESAVSMQQAVMQQLEKTDIFIGAAAVADYRPKKITKNKIKKTSQNWAIEMEPNPDIIAAVAASPLRPKVVLGFAAETDNVLSYAQKKLQAKKLDAVLANQVGENLAFSQEENQITILDSNGNVTALPMLPKSELAQEIMTYIVARWFE